MGTDDIPLQLCKRFALLVGGSAVAQYAYELFGNMTVTSGSSTNSYEYTGRENDGTGLYFNRARYYNPQLQRFISEDPIQFGSGDTNLYAYVGNDPTSLTDPNGNCPLCVVVIAAAGGVYGAVDQGVTAYSQGKSLNTIIDYTESGFVGGAAAATVGTIVGAGTENPSLIGASSSLTYYIVTKKLEGEEVTTTGALEATGSGAALGPLAKILNPGGVPVPSEVHAANEVVVGGSIGLVYDYAKNLINPQSASASANPNSNGSNPMPGRKSQ
jgi:RHS repeat-associated protein